MTKPTNTAKVASIMYHTSGVYDYDTALEIYEALAATDGPVQDTLDKFDDACRWSRLDDLSDADWWEEVEMLAHSITEVHKHFATKE